MREKLRLIIKPRLKPRTKQLVIQVWARAKQKTMVRIVIRTMAISRLANNPVIRLMIIPSSGNFFQLMKRLSFHSRKEIAVDARNKYAIGKSRTMGS